MEHDGYEGDQHHKHLRNQPMLERSLAEDPSRVFSWCHLASVREALGDPEGAEQAWGEAMRLVRGKVTRQPEDALPFLHQIERGLAGGGDVADLLDEARGMFGSNLQFAWLRGRALMAGGYPRPSLCRFATSASVREPAALAAGPDYRAVHVLRLYLAPFAEPYLASRAPGRPACHLDLDDHEVTTRRRIAGLLLQNGEESAARVQEWEAGRYERAGGRTRGHRDRAGRRRHPVV